MPVNTNARVVTVTQTQPLTLGASHIAAVHNHMPIQANPVPSVMLLSFEAAQPFANPNHTDHAKCKACTPPQVAGVTIFDNREVKDQERNQRPNQFAFCTWRDHLGPFCFFSMYRGASRRLVA
jgi:hypothetical protein